MATYEFSYWYKRNGDTEWQCHVEQIEANTDEEAKEKVRYPQSCHLPGLFYRGKLQEITQPKKKRNTLAWKPISYSR